MTQHGWRQTQALVSSARGQHAEAERLAREAVDLSLRTSSALPPFEGAPRLGADMEEGPPGQRGSTEALDRYERKPVIPLACRTRERLAALQPTQV
jgi:hypothetical protein